MQNQELTGKLVITTDTNIAMTIAKVSTPCQYLNAIDLNTGKPTTANLKGDIEVRLPTDQERRSYFSALARIVGCEANYYEGDDRINAGTILSFSKGRYLTTLLEDTQSGSRLEKYILMNLVDTISETFVSINNLSSCDSSFEIATPEQVEQYFSVMKKAEQNKAK